MSTRVETTPAANIHLSPGQLKRLRELLIEEHTIQQARAGELQDPEDLEPDLAEVLLARCQESLEEIETALRLIDDGTYGMCAGCGGAIPFERLEAVPATRSCVACQSLSARALR